MGSRLPWLKRCGWLCGICCRLMPLNSSYYKFVSCEAGLKTTSLYSSAIYSVVILEKKMCLDWYLITQSSSLAYKIIKKTQFPQSIPILSSRRLHSEPQKFWYVPGSKDSNRQSIPWSLDWRTGALIVTPQKGKRKGSVYETPSHSYGVSLATWDHTPTTRHKWTHPALAWAIQAGTWFTYPGGLEGWVDLGDWLHTKMVYSPTDGQPSKYLTQQCTAGSWTRNLWLQVRHPMTTTILSHPLSASDSLLFCSTSESRIFVCCNSFKIGLPA